MNTKPPEFDLAERIGELTNGAKGDVALSALIMNLCHVAYLADMSVDDLKPLLDLQMEVTKACMAKIRSIN